MDNRKLFNQTFKSEYFNPGKIITKKNQDKGIVDFYIFFTKNVSIDNICAFHAPYSYIHNYANSSYSEEEAFITDILLHHKIVDNPNSDITELYLSLIEYFCYGEEIRYNINSYPDGGFGIIALLDERYANPTITSVVDPEVNEGRFYYNG